MSKIMLVSKGVNLHYDIKENLMKALKQIFEYHETIKELVVDYGYKRVTYRLADDKGDELRQNQGA